MAGGAVRGKGNDGMVSARWRSAAREVKVTRGGSGQGCRERKGRVRNVGIGGRKLTGGARIVIFQILAETDKNSSVAEQLPLGQLTVSG